MEPAHWIEGAVFIVALISVRLLTNLEMTFSFLSRSSLERMEEDGVKYAEKMLKIYQPRGKVHLTVSVGKAISTAAATVSLVLLTSALCDVLEIDWIFGAIGAIVLSASVLLLLEHIPHRFGQDENGEEVIPKFRLSYYLLYFLLRPLAEVLGKFLGWFSDEADYKAIKEEELLNIVESESEEGIIEEDEKEMIQGVFGFHESTVKEVMVPRIDMVCAERSTTLGDLLNLIRTAGHSRIPVYDGTIDNICGVVYAKDLLQVLGTSDGWDLDRLLDDLIEEVGRKKADLERQDGRMLKVMREVYYIPENKKIDDLLGEFKSEKTHMAIVVDEYGGTAGLVTLEDLLEEIVGEIQDEYDVEEQPFQWIEEGRSLIADARIDIDDLNAMLDVDLPSEGFETLGGFVYDFLGRIPSQDETLQFGRLQMSIEEVDGRRISKVKITKLQAESGVEDKEPVF